MYRVGMIGLGKLGMPVAEVFSKTYQVVGYDIEPKKSDCFEIVDSIEEVVEKSDMIFIAAQTPHDPDYGGEMPTSHLPPKDFNYDIVKSILKDVNNYVDKSKLVILISTTLPGTVREQLAPLVSKGRFIYNPYLIAMGTVKEDLVRPEMVIIGTEEGDMSDDSRKLINFYTPMMLNNTRYEVGTWDDAESIKIFYNTFISTKISLVNMIQDVAVKNGNIDVDIVTNALAKSTQRITGPAYMKAGMGDGGACHPRDNIALRYLSQKLNLEYDLFSAIMESREKQADNIAKFILNYGDELVILGETYKPNVPYTDGSYSKLIGHSFLRQGGLSLRYYDPNTENSDMEIVSGQGTKRRCFFVGHRHISLYTLPFPDDSIIIDPWRECPTIENCEVIYYGTYKEPK